MIFLRKEISRKHSNFYLHPMNKKELEFFPIMGEALTKKNTVKMDFSESNPELIKVYLNNISEFDGYVFGQLAIGNYKYGIGGYLEHRAIYRRSPVFATASAEFRNIHLGVDIWTLAGTPIYAPLDGIVHSFQDNDSFGNYGPTIILEHLYEGKVFYSLYGHLKRSNLLELEKGMLIKKGAQFCHLGPYPENGDWPPHVHFQLMTDLLGNEGDFPGVCSINELGKFEMICPNPNQLLTCELL